MLEKLTTEQEKRMTEIRNEYLDLFFSGKEIDREEATKGIKWLYKFYGLKEPVMIFLDSPMASQVGCNYAIGLLKNKGNQVRNQVWDQVENQVENQVWDQVWNQVWNQVENQVGNQVENQVWNQVENQVGYKIFSSYGNYSDYGWLSFYTFFEDIGIVSNEGLVNFRNLIKSGVFMMIQLEGLCVVASLPKNVRRNGQNAMHSSQLPAIEWRDGYVLHYLNGVFFPEELWKNVTNGNMPFADILAIEDTDQRTQAMRYGNVWDFIKHENAEKLDEYTKIRIDGSEIHYWLYKFPKGKTFIEDAHYLIYDDIVPESTKQYMSGVIPSTTVSEAMAWKFSDDLHTLTGEQWKQLIPGIHEN